MHQTHQLHNTPQIKMDIIEQLRALANEAAIRSVPKLLKTAASEGLKATKKQAEEALAERVPAQVLKPPPRSSGKVFSESPQSRWACDLIDFSQNTSRPGGKAYILVLMQVWSRKLLGSINEGKNMASNEQGDGEVSRTGTSESRSDT